MNNLEVPYSKIRIIFFKKRIIFFFFAYSENFLLAIAADDRFYIRKLALRIIIKIREQTTNEISVRAFLSR